MSHFGGHFGGHFDTQSKSCKGNSSIPCILEILVRKQITLTLLENIISVTPNVVDLQLINPHLVGLILTSLIIMKLLLI